MRVVLDTTVIASEIVGLALAEAPPARLVRCWLDRGFVLPLSPEIIREVERTLDDPSFATRIPAADQARWIRLVRQAVNPQIARRVSGVTAHHENDRVPSTALSGQADVLVTGDKPFRTVGADEGIVFSTPREFFDLLDCQQNDPALAP